MNQWVRKGEPGSSILINLTDDWISPDFALPIKKYKHRCPPFINGADAMCCYWRVSLWLDLAQRPFDLYVPPEWRSLAPKLLRAWTIQLRKKPFEDITLGQHPYQWFVDILVPTGQKISSIPLPGLDGWPNQDTESQIWKDPIELGTDVYISINRRPIPESLRLNILTHYWQPFPNEPESPWVPPEWRGLTDQQRKIWISTARSHTLGPVLLGGVKYSWFCRTLAPIEQHPFIFLSIL